MIIFSQEPHAVEIIEMTVEIGCHSVVTLIFNGSLMLVKCRVGLVMVGLFLIKPIVSL